MILLYIWIAICLILFFLSIKKVRSNKKGCDFIYRWGFFIGAFVWEDLLIFSLFHIGVSVITIIFGDFKLWLLFFVVFWLVRSAGETLYYFLQQFIQPKHHPHYINAHFESLRNIFGNISEQKVFIILQVTMQVVLVVSIVLLFLLLQSWSSISLPLS